MANQADGAGRAAATGNGVGTPFELTFWQAVTESNDRAQLEAYLTQYPNGTFSGLARAKIAALAPPVAPVPAAAAPVASAPVPPAPVAALPVAPASVAPVPVAAPLSATAAILSGMTATSASAAPVAAAPAAAAPVAPASLLDQLTAVGKGGRSETPALFTVTGPVPARPAFAPVAAVTIPASFCSAVERNRFHDSVYVPAVAQADQNNTATIAHLQNVQALHAQAIAANNIAGANALAREATEFKPVADQAYTARIAMTDLFARIMAAPLSGC
ncbi:hypothetical protein LWE61_05635 [Sphingobium sufflavum]|uniref:hypothetical protein n=1 Tax=Sphingobium sufflavum TaxID=1129547 RepID=UPI001F24864E|nr:hypothetical protein [Sphingobium sufflavum]MCE7796041.1 hypothetical protein [Sphingobium sufflavum]